MVTKYPPKEDETKTVIKAWGDDGNSILKIIDFIRNEFPNNCQTSALLRSQKGGFHAFVTVYLKKESFK